MNNMQFMNDETDGMPMDDMGGIANNGYNPFDSNFDAGVEANEETDPKKYIQQLTGKLSQTLRSYNENLPQPDADLGKYVAGMIIKQAVKGLSPDDTNEILNKVKSDETEESNTAQEKMSSQEQPPTDGETNIMNNNMGESVDKTNKQKVDEIFNQVMQNDEESDMMQKPITNIGYKKKPFTSPNFK